MRNFNSYFYVLLIIKLSVFLMGCQHFIISNNFENNEVNPSHIDYFNFAVSQAITPEKLSTIFPKQLGGLEKTAIKLHEATGNAIAFYGHNKYEVSVTDDLRSNFSNIHLFEKNYRKLNNETIEGNVIKTVRDGYKTITIIESSKLTSITFIFKHRYIFKITGSDSQTPYMIWRFLELNKFDDLQE